MVFYLCKCGHEFEDIVDRCQACGRDSGYWLEMISEDEEYRRHEDRYIEDEIDKRRGKW